MRAVVWRKPFDIQVDENLPMPQLLGPRDAIVRVTRAGICGTDLHAYRGEINDFQANSILGHEFTGVVESLGPHVRNIRIGDRVLASDIIACGECWFCRRGWHYQCQSVSLFGYGTVVGPYVPGGQAEYVRVPFADIVLSRIPDSLTDEQVLFVGDILTTGFVCAKEANIALGDRVAVIGCGPVGLFALMFAFQLGAGLVLAIDPDPRRRAFAQILGGTPLAVDNDLRQRVHADTEGRGVDVALECVGSDDALLSALSIVRPCGTISIVGAHHSERFPFPSGNAFARELTLRFAVGDPIRWRDQMISILESGRIDATRIISHRLPLSDAGEGYRLFNDHSATKVILIP